MYVNFLVPSSSALYKKLSVPRQSFKDIFEKREFSIAFGNPRVDTCPICEKYKISITASKTPLKNYEFQLKRDLFQNKTANAQEMISQNI